MGVVYKIVHGRECVYVGSTIRPLSERVHDHRKRAFTHRHRPLYNLMNQVPPRDVQFVPIEVAEDDDLRTREQVWMDRLSPTLNVRRAKKKIPESIQDIKNKSNSCQPSQLR